MIDYTREDVINALEYLLSPVCTETQFDYCDEIRAAIALLKEQMPRVLTLEEVYDCHEGDYLYYEYNNGYSGNVLYIGAVKNYYVDFRSSQSRLCGDPSLYQKRWRCWTAKPTEEQRKAVEWNER